MFEIGSSLREARERRGLQLTDVQRETRIRVRYLQALEEERFDLLPGDAYVKGFLRSYADALGLESRLYLDEYSARFAQLEETDFVPRPSARLHGHRRRAPRVLGAVALVAVAAAVLTWRVGGSHHGAPPVPIAAAAAAPSLKVTLAKPKPLHVAPVHTSVLRLAALRGDCWLDVRFGSASGRRVWVGFLRRGGTMEFGLRRRLWLRLGNPVAVRVTLDGKPVSGLPGLATSVVFSASGWQPA
jgi:cytoskeleton protein RodZ